MISQIYSERGRNHRAQAEPSRTHKPDCNRIRFNKNHLCSCDAPSTFPQRKIRVADLQRAVDQTSEKMIGGRK